MISFAIYIRELINASLNNGPLQSRRIQNASLWNVADNISVTQLEEPCLTYISQWKSIRVGHATHVRGKCLSSKCSSSGCRSSHSAFNITLSYGYLGIRTGEDPDMLSFSVSKSCLGKIWNFYIVLSACSSGFLEELLLYFCLGCGTSENPRYVCCADMSHFGEVCTQWADTSKTPQHLGCPMLMTWKTKISNT